MAFVLAPRSDSQMSDFEDGDDKSNKEIPQEAENDLDNADFDFNVSDDDNILEIINHSESSNKDGNQLWQKRLIVNLRLIELRAMKTNQRKLQNHLIWNQNAVANIMLIKLCSVKMKNQTLQNHLN